MLKHRISNSSQPEFHRRSSEPEVEQEIHISPNVARVDDDDSGSSVVYSDSEEETTTADHTAAGSRQNGHPGAAQHLNVASRFEHINATGVNGMNIGPRVVIEAGASVTITMPDHRPVAPQEAAENKVEPIPDQKVKTEAKALRQQKVRTILIISVLVTALLLLVSVLYVSYSTRENEIPPMPSPTQTSLTNHITKRDWGADEPDRDYIGDSLRPPINFVIIAHTGVNNNECNSTTNCIKIVKSIANYHKNIKKWGDIGYNFLIGGDGKIYDGTGWLEMGAHSFGYNNHSIAIAFLGNFSNKSPPTHQVEAAHQLLQEGVTSKMLAYDFKLCAHRAFASTASPGDKLYELMQSWPNFVDSDLCKSMFNKYRGY